MLYTLRLRDYWWAIFPLLFLLAGLAWFASRFVDPAPPKRIAISTASKTGGYFATGTKYAAILKRSGITLDVMPSAGSGENVKRLLDDKSGIQVALLQGGTATTKEAPGVISLGRVYLEPLWVFYRGLDSIDRLSQIKGRRVIIGPEGSGTRQLALDLLKSNSITAENTTLMPLAGLEAIEAITKGGADVAFFTSSPNSPQIQTLMRTPDLRLMHFAQAEAYTRVFPYLSNVTLPKGAMDLDKEIPAQDTSLIAPMAALVVREDLHPALVGLLVDAAKEVHSPGGMFNRIGEFPKTVDPEFEMSDDALRFYKNGATFLQRHLPFWLATFIERMMILAVPAATVLIPVLKGGPALFRWRARQRILRWYARLKVLDQRLTLDSSHEHLLAYSAEIEDIEQAVKKTPVPLNYADQYYSLRAAVDLVRQRIAAHGGHPSSGIASPTLTQPALGNGPSFG
jgi:TRAP transporter TAXI family solute receptor